MCEFSPGEGRSLVTGSADRTFKTWQRECLGGGGEEGEAVAFLPSLGGAAGKGDTGGALAGATAAAALPPRYVWNCHSVGFWRDAPITAGAFSGDGSLLALAFQDTVTLWSPGSNALRGTLVFPQLCAGPAAMGAGQAPPSVDCMGFAGLSPFLVASSRGQGLVVYNLLTSSIAWCYTYASPESTFTTSLAFDRLGLATSSRFALGVGGRGGGALVLIFDAASVDGVPVASVHVPGARLQCGRSGESVGGAAGHAAPSAQNALALCFVPSPAPQSAGSDVLVLDAVNNATLLTIPYHGASPLPAPAAAAAGAEGLAQAQAQGRQAMLQAAQQRVLPSSAPSALAALPLSQQQQQQLQQRPAGGVKWEGGGAAAAGSAPLPPLGALGVSLGTLDTLLASYISPPLPAEQGAAEAAWAWQAGGAGSSAGAGASRASASSGGGGGAQAQAQVAAGPSRKRRERGVSGASQASARASDPAAQGAPEREAASHMDFSAAELAALEGSAAFSFAPW